jgi:hypothetical protein
MKEKVEVDLVPKKKRNYDMHVNELRVTIRRFSNSADTE